MCKAWYLCRESNHWEDEVETVISFSPYYSEHIPPTTWFPGADGIGPHSISLGVTRYSVLKAGGDAHRLQHNTLTTCMCLPIHFPIYLHALFLLHQPTVLSSAPDIPSTTKPLSYTISYQPQQAPIHSSYYSPPSIPLQPSSLILTVNLPTALYFFEQTLPNQFLKQSSFLCLNQLLLYGWTSVHLSALPTLNL